MITFLSIVAALLVVTSTSTVYSVLWLISCFIIISVLLGFLNLGFVSLLYIIVYVGAIAILFLFVIQLLDLGSMSEQPIAPISQIESGSSVNRFFAWSAITPLAVIISLGLFLILMFGTVLSLVSQDLEQNNLTDFLFNKFGDLPIQSLINCKNDTLLASTFGSTGQVQAIAEWFYGPGLLPLVVISVILLISMIAPISLCKDRL